MLNTFLDSVENYLMGNLNYTFEKELTCSVILTGMLLRCPAILTGKDSCIGNSWKNGKLIENKTLNKDKGFIYVEKSLVN